MVTLNHDNIRSILKSKVYKIDLINKHASPVSALFLVPILQFNIEQQIHNRPRSGQKSLEVVACRILTFVKDKSHSLPQD